jgi:hypothetical protein
LSFWSRSEFGNAETLTSFNLELLQELRNSWEFFSKTLRSSRASPGALRQFGFHSKKL